MKYRRKKWIYQMLLIGLSITLLVSVWMFFSINSLSDKPPIEVVFQSEAQYSNFEFREETDKENINEPLESLVTTRYKTLQFWDLPKRRFGRMYGEITTANRDTSEPLYPDFTFHSEYQKHNVTLYEDYGPGCIFRLYLMPNLPTDANEIYSMTAKDLKTSALHFIIDGEIFIFSLEEVMLADNWPFQSPISTQHKKLSSGIGAYTPICYQHHIKIAYSLPEPLPTNLFEQTINCTGNDLLCPVKIYSAVSRHKFPHSRQVPSFAELKTEGTWLHKVVLSNTLHAISHPHKHGPHWGDNCVLSCTQLSGHRQAVIFSSNKPGLISTIRLRVYHPTLRIVIPDWTSLLVTMTWDGASIPQVNKVPLGSLFGATASLNDFQGVSMGKKVSHCYHDSKDNYPPDGVTGYFYFPMPFWKSAKIVVEGTTHLPHEVSVCSQILSIENHYNMNTTAYFHATKTYYTSEVKGWRNVLGLDDAWGSFVGLLMDVDNLRAVRGVPLSQRWAALQADPVIYIDDMKSASVFGTGLEDYFSYSHGFVYAENTSYAFVGVYHASPRRNEPLTWHCYRLHVLDPIIFHKSIHFIMEGTSKEWDRPERGLSYDKYMKKKRAGETTISHLALFYAQKSQGLVTTDEIIFGDKNSEKGHSYTLTNKGTKNYNSDTSDTTFNQFSLSRKSFIGSYTTKAVHNVVYIVHGMHSLISFSLKIDPNNKGVFLRRRFYSVPKQWNHKAQIIINGRNQGIWFTPMGSLVEQYSLQEDDFLISSSLTANQDLLNVQIEPLSVWHDIAYFVYCIL